ncbi:MAG: SH3 domain-containing protein [Pseudomonadota bacterium]
MNRILRRLAGVPVILAALAAAGTASAEPGTLLRDSELRAKPFGDAAVVAALKAKDSIDIVARQGAWAQVKAGGQAGWVRVLNVRTGSGQRGDAGVGQLASVFKTGSSGTTVTTGVKGLSEQKLATAEPAPAEARRLDQYRETEAGARGFARQAKLASQELPFFDAQGKEVTK